LRLALFGFGNVGQALARMLLATHAPFTVTAIVTRRGESVNPGGIDLARTFADNDRARAAMATMDSRTHGNFDPGMPWEPTPIGRLPADVLVEMTPLDPVAGEPALTYIRDALTAGMHVVTANKGPIARAYRELDALATTNGRMLRFEATLADCLPVFTLRRSALPLAKITAIRGIVSSTNNHILTAAAAGVPFADALAEAQRLGIAEADPRNDLEGHDAAAKATILANVLMDADLRPEIVSREPIDERAARAARAAAQSGDRVRPVIEIARRDGAVVASFGPRRLAPLDPLYAVDDFSMGLVFETDLAGRVVVQLHDPHVDQVAYAILTDLLEISAADTMPRR
jgi:homoserine dehydrogenase